jgi:flagellar hook-basal body complex protein FliE
MSAPISGISSIPLPEISSPAAAGASGGGEFQDLLSQAIGGVERLRGDAHHAVEQFISGESSEVHTVALATQRAELAFETFVQLRNKVVSAYQAVMQMQI